MLCRSKRQATLPSNYPLSAGLNLAQAVEALFEQLDAAPDGEGQWNVAALAIMAAYDLGLAAYEQAALEAAVRMRAGLPPN